MKEDKIGIQGEIEEEKKIMYRHCIDKEQDVQISRKEIEKLQRYIDEIHKNLLKKK